MFYASAAAAYGAVAGGSLIQRIFAARLASILWGVLTVAFAFLAGWWWFGRRRDALLLALLFLCQPTLGFFSSVVNNDSALFACSAAAFAEGQAPDRPHPLRQPPARPPRRRRRTPRRGVPPSLPRPRAPLGGHPAPHEGARPGVRARVAQALRPLRRAGVPRRRPAPAGRPSLRRRRRQARPRARAPARRRGRPPIAARRTGPAAPR